MSAITMSKKLMLILTSIMAALATEADSDLLSGSFNAEKYKTDVMTHRLLLKHNITRREVSLMFDKVGSENEGQYEMEERFNKSNGDAYTRKDGAWIFPLNDLSGSRFENHTYIIYVLAGEIFIIRSWSLNDATLSFTIKEGDSVRLSASFNAGTYEIVDDKKQRLVLKHNITRKEVSLMFDKVGNEDEGQYEMKESLNKSNGETYTRIEGAWLFHLNVLEPDEIKRGNVGENLTILQLKKSTSSFRRLYHYDQVVTVLRDTDCDISSESHLYGRLRCQSDEVENRYVIEIQNVAQRDTGLYRVNTDGHDTERCFLNITDQTTTVKSHSVTSSTVQGSFPHAVSSVAVEGTTVASELNTLTIHDSTEESYYSQLRTESLSPTVNSISTENTSNPLSVPIYIIPIIVGSVGGIILMICCIIRIKHKNTYSLEGGTNSL